MGWTIIGAGMAGLLAGGMLRNEVSGILEQQSGLPNNHHAVLRFRSSIVGDTLNIPFKPVQVMKAVHGSYGNPVADALAYSVKTNGSAELRSITTANGELVERWIAPPDLIQRMADRVIPITFDGVVNFDLLAKLPKPIIWTGPMSALMKLLDWPQPGGGFRAIGGAAVRLKLAGVNAYASLYYPNQSFRPYRATLTGDELIIEYSWPNEPNHMTATEDFKRWFETDGCWEEIIDVLESFGLSKTRMSGDPTLHPMRYTKILPIYEQARRNFILHATQEYGIYSLGRFATWRPGLMLDDLVQDVRVIQQVARSGQYAYRK